MTTLTQLLTITGHPAVKTLYFERIDNSCFDEIIERLDHSWESLIDFERSDWVNLHEPYTSDLLKRYQRHARSIHAMFNDYCEAIGAESVVHALEGECNNWEDGDDMNASIVNYAMTHAASELLSYLTQWADEHPDHQGPIWDKLRSLA